jgi:acyl-CoA synthetase (NDP forming)
MMAQIPPGGRKKPMANDLSVATMQRTAMQRFMRPRSIAVVGAASKPGALGAGVIANLDRFAYDGEIYLVNPNRTEIGGRPCLPDIDHLPLGVDCVVLAIPAKGVPDAVEACARRGVGGIVVYASGFAEAGVEGAAAQAHIASAARSAGMVLEGPNCLGYVNNVDGIALTFGPTQPNPVAGRRAISVVAQSGSMSGVIRAASVARGMAVGYSVSTGNEAASGVEDYLDFLLDDADTSVVSLFVEQFRQPERFIEFCRRARGRGLRIVLFHVARSEAGQESARTHTGAMSGNYEAMRAVVEHEGVICVDTLEELLDVGELLVRFPEGLYGNLAIITESGAFKSIAVDYCDQLDIHLHQPGGATAERLAGLAPELIEPKNPVDLTGLAVSDPQLFGRCVQPFLDDSRYSVLLLNKTGSSGAAMLRSGSAILASMEAMELTKPVIFTTLGDEVAVPSEIVDGFRALNVPFYRSPERALRAIATMQRHQQSPEAAAIDGTDLIGDVTHIELPSGVVAEHRSKEMLKAIGIEVPGGRLVDSATAATDAARSLGFPVAMKVQASRLAHKTEAGGVLLALEDERAVAAAWTILHDSIAAARPDLTIDGVLVERMASKGLEMIVGARRDPHWGPVVVVGMGGIWAEALHDIGIVPAQASSAAIRAVLGRLRSAALLGGWRGSPAVDIDALCSMAQRVGQLMYAREDILEIDLNPVIVRGVGLGAVALDALIVTEPE